jgi:hypothetical protein
MVLQIDFTRKIAGKLTRLSISIPAEYVNTYVLEPGAFVNVLLQDCEFNPEFISKKFSSAISKCGLKGRIIYIPKRFAEEYKLQAGQSFYFIVEVL